MSIKVFNRPWTSEDRVDYLQPELLTEYQVLPELFTRETTVRVDLASIVSETELCFAAHFCQFER